MMGLQLFECSTARVKIEDAQQLEHALESCVGDHTGLERTAGAIILIEYRLLQVGFAIQVDDFLLKGFRKVAFPIALLPITTSQTFVAENRRIAEVCLV